MPIIIIDGYISDGFNAAAAASTPQRRSAPAPVQHDPFWATTQDKPRRFESIATDIAHKTQREEEVKKPAPEPPVYRGGSYIII